jgi:hypothetical protein
MTMRTTLFLLATLAVPFAATAADGTYTFRLLPDPNNMTACIGMEPSFERPYTLVMANGTGTLTSAGGVSLHMSPSAADNYHGIFELSGERLDYTAALGATKTLSVRGNNLGCRFSGKAT